MIVDSIIVGHKGRNDTAVWIDLLKFFPVHHKHVHNWIQQASRQGKTKTANVRIPFFFSFFLIKYKKKVRT